MTQDPIGLEGGMNMYAFGLNDPVNHSDPLGLQDCPLYARHENGRCVQDVTGVEIQGADDDRANGYSPNPSDRGGRPGAIGPIGWLPPAGFRAPKGRSDAQTARARACFAKRLEVAMGIAGDAAVLTGVGAAARWALVGARYGRAALMISNTPRLAKTNRLYYASQASLAAYQTASERAVVTAGSYFSWAELQHTAAQVPNVTFGDFLPFIGTIGDIKEMLALCRS
jgi:uncharacterized protein RhaS with RHS repeats